MFNFWAITLVIEIAMLLYLGHKANDDRTGDKEQYAVTFFLFMALFLLFDVVAVCWQLTRMFLHK